uniref:Uncharacterized protein n=1 Tax=Ditylenchus dipsaci TaxID=166011 RepID=A0A915D482_9BILA
MTFLEALLIVSCTLASVSAWPWSHHNTSKEDSKYTVPKKEGVAVPATNTTEEYAGPFGSVLRIIATIVRPLSPSSATQAPPSATAIVPPTSSTITLAPPPPVSVATQAAAPEMASVPQLPVPQALVGEVPSTTTGVPSTAWNWNDGTAPNTLAPAQIYSTTTPLPASAMSLGPFKAAVIATALLVVATLLF